MLLRNIHVGKVTGYINESVYARDVVTENIVWDNFESSQAGFTLNGFAPAI